MKKLQYCTKEQVAQLLELGCPLEKVIKADGVRSVYYTEDYDSPTWANCDAYYYPYMEEIQKWLREEKLISITISWLPNIKKYSCVCSDMNYIPKEHSFEESHRIYKEQFEVRKNNRQWFDSYEEALSVGIDKAIELILQ